MRSNYRIGKRTLPLVVGLGLILAGVLLVAGVGPVNIDAPIATRIPLASVAAASPSAGGSVAIPAATRDPRAPIATGYRIQIFRLGIDLPVEEGDIPRDIERQKTPERFAFHRPGDEVFISTPDLKVLKYVVVEVHPRVAYEDVSWVQPASREQLTLRTSTGPNPNDPRYVAVAVPAM